MMILQTRYLEEELGNIKLKAKYGMENAEKMEYRRKSKMSNMSRGSRDTSTPKSSQLLNEVNIDK